MRFHGQQISVEMCIGRLTKLFQYGDNSFSFVFFGCAGIQFAQQAKRPEVDRRLDPAVQNSEQDIQLFVVNRPVFRHRQGIHRLQGSGNSLITRIDVRHLSEKSTGSLFREIVHRRQAVGSCLDFSFGRAQLSHSQSVQVRDTRDGRTPQ